ncbi:GumC family protein [Mesorhizobium sp. M1E.F.Ca.ET.063.01.1.1]|uniref:Wzz/FepE/Etk N-terminal domain-containing protein n=1 Tax=Mesorhizobium sp. M1E.F.Ca.ET.063.01.1.1 TaxID=2496750 RepID=UPI000FCBB0A1|nr:GumC family protein [Mesorhizobium sp. M1E.F.Ca.ET.063.01.1.1]RUW84481.1 succinoglycan biosynthesis protein exop [Mesorhizobium sp. M1E.F.Ca.ET.063.01.1.1]
MVDRENRDDWRRERSLLALGQAVRGEDTADASLVSIGDKADPSWREDAAARHRAARFEREGRSDPQAANIDEPGQHQVDPLSETVRAGNERAAQEAHPQAGRREEGRSPDYSSPDYSSAPAFEPRHAEPRYASRPLTGNDPDAQEWKPLIDPMQVVRGITRSKALIVSTTILGAALGITIALSTPKKYEATTEVIVDPRDLKLTDRDLTQNVVASDATLAIVENQVRILTSGTVLNKVVTDLNLTDDPEFNGQGKSGIAVMSILRSILSRQDAQGPADDARRNALAVRNLAESLDVERGGKTFVVSVTATTQDPDKSAQIANAMITAFQEISSKIQSNTAGRATDELTARLDELRKGVETAERKVEDFRATHDLVDAQGHLISDDQMLKLNEQLSVARARTLELNARAASARALNVNSVLNGTLPEEINSNTMGELRSQYAALKQEADRATVRLGPRHPEIEALNAQLAGARERISAELRRIASSLQVDLKRSVQLEQDLASRLAQAKVQSGDVNNNLVSLRELEREAAAKRSVYEQFLLRAKETGEQKDINTANINVISEAYPPLEAKGPSRAVKALAGLLAGLFAGIGLGALRGAYASLRETANARSRRRTDGRASTSEGKSNQAAPPAPSVKPSPASPVASPPPATSVAPAPVRGGRPGFLGALASSLRYLTQRGPGEAVDTGAVPGESARRAPAQGTHSSHPQAPQRGDVQPPPAQGSYSYRPDYERPDPHDDAYLQPPTAGARQSPEVDQQGQIDELRASLREFREAVRDLTESRSRRRYF